MFLYSMPEARRYLNQDMSYFVGGYLLPAVVAIVTIIVITVCIRQMRSAMVFTACLIAVHTGEMVIHHFLDANRNLQYAEILESETRLSDQMEVVRETLRINQGRIVAVDGPNNPFVQMNMSRAWELPTIGGKKPIGFVPLCTDARPVGVRGSRTRHFVARTSCTGSLGCSLRSGSPSMAVGWGQ